MDAPPNTASVAQAVCVFEQIGYRNAGQKGSHIQLEKPGVARPLIVPRYDEVGQDIVTNLIRSAGITRQARIPRASEELLAPNCH